MSFVTMVRGPPYKAQTEEVGTSPAKDGPGVDWTGSDWTGSPFFGASPARTGPAVPFFGASPARTGPLVGSLTRQGQSWASFRSSIGRQVQIHAAEARIPDSQSSSDASDDGATEGVPAGARLPRNRASEGPLSGVRTPTEGTIWTPHFSAGSW